MISAKIVGMLVAAFAAGSFFASPELRAYASTIANDVICSGCVGTTDLANNAVTSAKIKDFEVKTADIGGGAVTNAKLANGAVNSAKIADNSITAADIAPDAVGASELQGVTKLIFSECRHTDNTVYSYGGSTSVTCTVPGAATGDNVLATLNESTTACFDLRTARVFVDNLVRIILMQDCEGRSVALTHVEFTLTVTDTQ